MVTEIIEKQKQVRFERAHFRSFGNSALEFEVIYWVLSADYTAFMDEQQTINFAIFRGFQNEGIEFAFPSQTLYVPELKGAFTTMARTPESQPRPAESQAAKHSEESACHHRTRSIHEV